MTNIDDSPPPPPDPKIVFKRKGKIYCEGPEPEPPERSDEDDPLPKGIARQAMRYLIDKRLMAVYNNPRLLTDKRYRMDQSDIFYPMRTMLQRKGYDVSSFAKGDKRQDLYSYIKDYCEDALGIKR